MTRQDGEKCYLRSQHRLIKAGVKRERTGNKEIRGQWNGLGKAGTFGDREKGTAATTRIMFDTPRQFPIREI